MVRLSMTEGGIPYQKNLPLTQGQNFLMLVRNEGIAL